MQDISLPDDIVAAFRDDASAIKVISLMGPNGSGKSQLLEQTRNHLKANRIPCLLMPSARNLQEFTQGTTMRSLPPPTSGQSHDDHRKQLLQILFDPAAPPGGAFANPAAPGQLPLTFGTALSHLLWYASQDRFNAVTEYISENAEFKAGRRQTAPTPPDTDTLFELSTKIEDILRYPTKIKSDFQQGIDGPRERLAIRFERDGTPFPPEALSDGEKQILLLCIFLVGSDADRLVFLIDEPELFLNEALAIEIWQRLEKNFPNAIFLYATHNPNFATRNGVHQLYVMSRNRSLERLDTTKPVPSQTLREIVGTRVQLLRADAAPIFCEDALAQNILEDLFSADKFVIVPLHNRDTVINAVRKERGWELLRSEGPKHCGVIDRDTADDEEVGKLETLGVFCFPRYEAESLLLDPTVAIWALSLAGTRISTEQYAKILVECARTRRDLMLRKLAKHVARHQILEPLRFDAGEAEVKNIRPSPTDALISRFKERAAAAYAAISTEDTNAILTIFKGKCLYKTMQSELKEGAIQIRLGRSRTTVS